MASGFDQSYDDDYVPVAQRIRIFREKYPEGSLRPLDPSQPFTMVEVGGRTYVATAVAAFRTPTDRAPGVGQAWCPVPGTTEYSSDSELMIAETSAIGRAIVNCLAADASKSIASREEVKAAQEHRKGRTAAARTAPAKPTPEKPSPTKAATAKAEKIATGELLKTIQDAHDADDGALPLDAEVQRVAEARRTAIAEKAAATGAQLVDEPTIESGTARNRKTTAAKPEAAQESPDNASPNGTPPAVNGSVQDDEAVTANAIVQNVLTIIHDPEATTGDLRDAWDLVSQAGLLARRVPTVAGLNPDPDEMVAVGTLVAFIGRRKADAEKGVKA